MDLRHRLEALPQELYDNIFELTFTPSDDQRRFRASNNPRQPTEAKCSATFPHLLHVSRSTRAMFAASYYGNPVGFSVYDPHSNIAGVIGLTRWLNLLPREHRGMIKRVRVLLGNQVDELRSKGFRTYVLDWQRHDWIVDLSAYFRWYGQNLKAELLHKITVEVEE